MPMYLWNRLVRLVTIRLNAPLVPSAGRENTNTRKHTRHQQEKQPSVPHPPWYSLEIQVCDPPPMHFDGPHPPVLFCEG